MSSTEGIKMTQDESNLGTIFTYTAGFILSLSLTSFSFYLVHRHVASGHVSPTDKFMVIALSVLAVTQLFVQLIFFLHLDRESKPRWNLTVLMFALIVVFIIVAGSLWIMYHLNYNMSPQQMNNYMLRQDGGI
ncbi:MAG: cytochrome o ubiquinol oxidase subunit IV [Candidatus Saccharimonadales bacterium]